jgi:hypothetical protein
MAAKKRLKEDLAVELYTHIKRTLAEFGLTPKEQRRAMDRAWRARKAPRVSGPLIRDVHGLGRILLQWSREPEYLDDAGKPRVLSIKGIGSTFETLAQRSIPQLPVDQVVELACETAEVAIRPGGKIALLGSILVKVLKSEERLLAHVVRQVDQLLTTSLHNRRMHRQGLTGGRMERLSIGLIPQGEFKAFMQELRPQIYDLLLHVDSSLQRREPKTAKALKTARAVSVGIYASEEPDLERAGVAVHRVRRRSRRR